MSFNQFGRLFRFTSWGESHGEAIGCVIDGVPAGIALDAAEDIQPFLDKRRPGRSRFTSARREPDKCEILSGLFEGQTTGAPLLIFIRNKDARSKDYDEIAKSFRPGHADYTYQLKYGIRDWRGGGRSSARETAARVAAGAVARKILPKKIKIKSAVVQLGEHKVEARNWKAAAENLLFCPDPKAVPIWEKHLDSLRREGSSCGAVIEVRVANPPAGLGAPIYGKLDADLAAAMMSINAVKGVEIGDGFAAAALTGEENADEMRMKKGKPVFLSNHAGGVLGGIGTGEELIIRFAVKPTSSIRIPRKTINRDNKEQEIITKGRHDPCVGIRAAPVGEAMAACVLADHLLLARAARL